MEQVTPQETPKVNFLTETIELPSKGLLYPKDNILSKGIIEIKYMTAAHEDILTNQTYIQKGNVLDKLMQALIVTPISYDDLIVGDKNAIMIASRILGYGKNYSFTYNGQEETIDLSTLESKELDLNAKKIENSSVYTYLLENCLIHKFKEIEKKYKNYPKQSKKIIAIMI